MLINFLKHKYSWFIFLSEEKIIIYSSKDIILYQQQRLFTSVVNLLNLCSRLVLSVSCVCGAELADSRVPEVPGHIQEHQALRLRGGAGRIGGLPTRLCCRPDLCIQVWDKDVSPRDDLQNSLFYYSIDPHISLTNF